MSKKTDKSASKKPSKKKSPVKYSVSSSTAKVIQEQTGLSLYPDKEKKASVLEVKKSDSPKISKFNDIDLI